MSDHDMPWHAPIRRGTATVKSKTSSQILGGKNASEREKRCSSQHAFEDTTYTQTVKRQRKRATYNCVVGFTNM